ncbi:hypothetical protein KL86PLE_100245 [uncultured Pleomorphomonas sp.]|uniref:Uncharacterized protein n=1 Tax=uncultured Pleomorphomonas sp. TaxID=442121 RepID=A0A212L1U4_9HYPH|nr:capsid cement protein [uncultured Pleomorphomonas sp.]SCM71512.1 hypothetical protein KL86PLE_100245 [uncultured Pleomorphomonas sp.]
MTTQANGLDITRLAGADLSSSQYLFVKLDANAQVVVAGAGEDAIGVLQNKPAAGQAATVRVGGLSKVVAGAAITAGARVASDASGKAKTAVAATVNTSDTGAAADAVVASFSMGHAFEAASGDGQVIEILLAHSGALPTTAA